MKTSNNQSFSIWDERARLFTSLQGKAVAVLQPLGMRREAFDYAISCRDYLRLPPLCTFWCADGQTRESVNVGIAIHCLGIKLIDDLLDEDTPYSRVDLSAGVFAIQTGTALLCASAETDRVHAILQRYWANIWKYLLRELRVRPNTFEEWVETARVKSGQIFECYTEIACCAANIPFISAVHARFASALGTLIMVRDDFKDFQDKAEESGNLAYLLTQGVVQETEIALLIDKLYADATAALAADGTKTDIDALLREMHGDARNRLSRIAPSGNPAKT